MTIALMPLLTRAYGHEAFGLHTTLVAVVGMLLSLATGYFDVAIPLPTDDADAISLGGLALLCAVVVAAASGVMFILYGRYHESSAPGIANYAAWYVPVAIVGMAMYQVGHYSLLRKDRLVTIATGRTAQTSLQALLPLSLLVSGSHRWGLLLGDCLGRFVGGSVVLSAARRGLALNIGPSLRLGALRRVLRRYRRFALLSCPSAVLDSATAQLPAIAIAAAFGVAVAGVYGLAHRLLALPIALLATSISNIYLADAAADVRNGVDLRPRATRISVRLFLIGAPFAMGAMVGGPFLFEIVFGSGWRTAGEFARVLAPMYLMQLLAAPIGTTLVVLERQDLHAMREIVRFSLTAITMVLWWQLDLSPIAALTLLSVVGSLAYAMYIGVSYWAMSQAVSLSEGDRGSRSSLAR